MAQTAGSASPKSFDGSLHGPLLFAWPKSADFDNFCNVRFPPKLAASDIDQLRTFSDDATYSSMRNEAALMALGQYLHQGIDLHASNLVELVTYVLDFMSPEERKNLRAYLAVALEKDSPSELKGQLNRANENFNFGSKAAAQFLREVADQLSSER